MIINLDLLAQQRQISIKKKKSHAINIITIINSHILRNVDWPAACLMLENKISYTEIIVTHKNKIGTTTE